MSITCRGPTPAPSYYLPWPDPSPEGCSGNLIDVLQLMASDDKRRAYERGELGCEENKLIVNWELKMLMIPPEHRERIEPLLQQLRDIKL